jgi:23S rRNA (guanosine2251-2'-O)-methyltransferase
MPGQVAIYSYTTNLMKKRNEDYLLGFHSIIEAINAGKTIDKVLIKKGLRGELFQECFRLIRHNNIPFQYVPSEKLNRISRTNHQGVIALVSAVDYFELTHLLPEVYEAGKEPFFLILDGITDIRNFGAIARSAESAGVDAIVLGTKNAASVNAEAVKISAGALTRIPVCRVTNIQESIKYLQESGLKIVGASEKTSEIYFTCKLTGPLGLVMGGEDKGLSDGSLKQVDTLVKIPMLGNISSLNVSVAAGILLFEVVRQRLK